MADQKVSQLTHLTNPSAEDLLYAVDDPNGTPTSKKLTIKNLFGNVRANTNISANLSVSGNRATVAANAYLTKTTVANTLVLTLGAAPASNNTTTEGWQQGQIRITNTHIYFAVGSTVIKRIALDSF